MWSAKEIYAAPYLWLDPVEGGGGGVNWTDGYRFLSVEFGD